MGGSIIWVRVLPRDHHKYLTAVVVEKLFDKDEPHPRIEKWCFRAKDDTLLDLEIPPASFLLPHLLSVWIWKMWNETRMWRENRLTSTLIVEERNDQSSSFEQPLKRSFYFILAWEWWMVMNGSNDCIRLQFLCHIRCIKPTFILYTYNLSYHLASPWIQLKN